MSQASEIQEDHLDTGFEANIDDPPNIVHFVGYSAVGISLAKVGASIEINSFEQIIAVGGTYVAASCSGAMAVREAFKGFFQVLNEEILSV